MCDVVRADHPLRAMRVRRGGVQPAGFQPGAGRRYENAATSITTK